MSSSAHAVEAGKQSDRQEGLLRYAPALVVLAVFVVLAARLFRLISRYAVDMFFSDQWDFNNATLFEKHSLWEMFRWQHGPHRQGLGAILSYFLEPHFQWNSRTESFFIGGLIVVAALCALWLKWRLFHSLDFWDALIPVILFTPLQTGQIFIVANWSHGPVPLFLMILFCLAWTVPSVPWRYALVLAINFIIVNTGFGLFLGLITPLALTADYFVNLKRLPRGKFLFAGALLISLLSFASYFVGYVYVTAVDCQPNLFQSPGTYAKFVLLMFANVIAYKGLTRHEALAGAALLACVVWAFLANCHKLRRPSPTFATHLASAILLAYAVLFSAIAAYGRSCVGLPEAQVSRYVMYLELGLLGLYFSVRAVRTGYLRLAMLFLLALVLAKTIRVVPPERFAMEYYRDLKTNWKSCYLKSSDIAFCDRQTGQWIYNPGSDQQIQSRLDYLKRTRQNLYADPQ